jgi:hypothetical protein
MNRKQLLLLLGAAIVLGGIGLIVLQRNKSSWKESGGQLGQKLLGDLPVNDVAQISIKQGTNQLDLAKKDVWTVAQRNNYPANYSEISEFLLKAKDLKAAQSEKVGASALGRLGLAQGDGTNNATVVEFKDQAAKPIRTLLLGKKHMKKSNRPAPMGEMGGEEGWPDGRWVKLAQGDSVAVISDPLANIEPKPEQWLNKDFFKAERIRSIAVSFPVETNSWKLTRETETAEWKLADAKPNEQLDTGKASSAASPLGYPSFNDVSSSNKPEELGLDKPTTVTVDTFDNFTYVLKFGTKTNDTFPLMVSASGQLPKDRTPGKDEKPEDKDKLDKEFKEKQKKLEEKLAQEKKLEKWTYLVSSWSFESLLKDRSQILQEKKEEPKPDAAAGGTNAPPADPAPDAK